MITREDVAKRANVSPTVVSYVLNNSNYVKQEKRDAVLKAVQELGYIPNQIARSLLKKKTNHIAVLRGNALNDMFNDLLFNMEGIAYKYGYNVSLLTIIQDENGRAKEEYVDELISRHYDAIFVANSSMTEKQLLKLKRNGVPVLLYPTKDYIGLDNEFSYLAPDYRNGVKTLIEFLIDQGHTRIAFIPNFLYPNVWDQSNHRFDGYIHALAARGVPLNVSYVCKGGNRSIDQILASVDRLFDPKVTREPPTAIYVDESIIAGKILKHLNSRGIRVPDDVSMVSSSDSTISQILTPSLTAVGVNPHELAEKAMEMILQIIEGQMPPGYFMPMSMYVRESVKTMSVPDGQPEAGPWGDAAPGPADETAAKPAAKTAGKTTDEPGRQRRQRSRTT